MKIGLFGGSFNPVHVGHLLIIERAKEQLGLDKVIVVPAACNPHKKHEDMAPDDTRLVMMKCAIQGMVGVEVSDYEIRKGGKSYTINTINHIIKTYKPSELFLIIGADAYCELYKWHKINNINNKVRFAVARRPGYNHYEYLDRPFAKIDLDIPNIEISATDLRSRIKRGASTRFLIPYEVEKWIDKIHLYR